MTEAPDKPTKQPVPSKEPPDERKPYRRPRLEVFGEIRDVTMGVTPGGLESGGIPRKPVGL